MKFKENEMSQQEKEILSQIVPRQSRLNYPTMKRVGKDGFSYEVYVIPKDDMQRVLDSCWPFEEIPNADEIRFDVHSKSQVCLRDCLCIRYDWRNLIVSQHFL